MSQELLLLIQALLDLLPAADDAGGGRFELAVLLHRIIVLRDGLQLWSNNAIYQSDPDFPNHALPANKSSLVPFL
jgi:hypothetical protein